jgi:Helix-turn-helix domain
MDVNGVSEPLLGLEDAEASTGISRYTWRRWAYDRKVSSVKLGKRLLIPVSEIDRLIAEGMRPKIENAA